MPDFLGQTAVKFEPQYYSTEYDLGNSGSGTIAIDWNNGNCQLITMTGNCTFAAPTNMKAGARYLLRMIEDSTGYRAPIWDDVFIWPNSIVPTLSGGGVTDLLAFYCDGVNLYGSYGSWATGIVAARDDGFDELQHNFRLLLKTWVVTGFDIPEGLEDEFIFSLEE